MGRLFEIEQFSMSISNSVRNRRSEFQEPFTDHTRLQPAHLKFLSVRQQGDVCTAGHHVDLDDGVDVGEGAASEPYELSRVEASLEIPQPVRNGMLLVLHRREMQQFA